MGFFRRLARIFRGFLGLFIGGIEKSNPKAVLEAHVQDFQENQAKFNQNLAKQDAHRRRLALELKKLREKEKGEHTRIEVNLKSGNRERAGTLAAQRKATLQSIERTATLLKEAEEMFNQLTRQRDLFVKEARTKIENIRGKISQAEMAKAQANLSEMASDLAFDPNSSGLSDLEGALDEQITEAQGRTRVATEADTNNSWVVSEAEAKAMEQDALAEFAAEFGMAEKEPAEKASEAKPQQETVKTL